MAAISERQPVAGDKAGGSPLGDPQPPASAIDGRFAR